MVPPVNLPGTPSTVVAVLAGSLLLTACGGDETTTSGPTDHRPTYAATAKAGATKPATRRRHQPSQAPSALLSDTPSAAAQATASGSASPSGGSGGSGGSSGSGAGSTIPTTTGSVSDGRSDVSSSSLQRPPAYADLTGADLTRSADGFVLRVGAAAAFPGSQPDADHTENVIFYADIDGDGHVDYEVWASLADNGWGTSYFDDPNGDAYYGANSGVRATVSGGTLVVAFTLDHLADASRFRWSVQAEYGSYTEVQTGTTSLDAAPGSGPAQFPG